MDNNYWNHDYVQIARDSGFKLKQIKEGELDWRLLGTVDIDTLVRTQHLQRLDTLIEHVAEAPLAKILDSNILDSGVVKYFHLAQLSVQYLLFCKRFLDKSLAGVRTTLQTLRAENIQLESLNKESNDELLKLHKKLQKIEDINQIVFPCSLCPKNFLTNEMLDTHIKRKHSKAAGKATVENDINLINTIKLELEIKHLKERLNVAEREIRDKQHSACKDSRETEKIQVDLNSKEVNQERKYVTVGTQTDTSTRNVGIQNNLEEPKELDESADSEKSVQQEIVTALRDKLAIFEEWKKKEATETGRSIAFIQTKVEEMLATVDHKLTKIQEAERTDVDTVPSGITQDDIKEMQKIFSDNLGKICKENELKLSSTIRTFETGYRSKLENLENLIARYEKSLMQVGESAKKNDETNGGDKNELNRTVTVATREVKKPPENTKPPNLGYVKQVTEVKKFAETDTDSESSGAETISVISHKPVIKAMDSNELHSSAESVDSEDVQSEAMAIPDKRRNIVLRPKTARMSIKPIKKSIEESEMPERAKPTLETLRLSAIKLFHKRLKLFGLNSHTKAISKQAKDDIAEILVERRNVFRKKHPNYFVVRNKLRQMIDKRAKERMQPIQTHNSLQKELQKLGGTSHPNSDRHTATVADVVSADSSETENEPLDPNEKSEIAVTTNQSPSIEQTDDRDKFKERLERILASPIRKPVIHMRAPTPTRITTPTTSQSPLNNGHKKPIPTPRKKVMFDMNSSDSGNSRPRNQERPPASRNPPRNSEDESESDHPPVGIIRKANSESSSISSLL